MYVLVYFGVLHDDESVQLAHENRIFPLPDVWWQSDAYTYANTDSDAYSDTDTNAYTNTNTDSYTNAYTDSNADACTCA